MIRGLVVVTVAASLLIACEGRRAVDNPDNLDNMPVEADRVEDTADLHNTTAREPDDTTTTIDNDTTRSGEL